MQLKLSEKQIQNQIIEYLQYRKDIYFIRNNSIAGKIIRPNGSQGWIKNNKKGSPDIIICFKGKWIGCEIKCEKGKQSPEQKQAELEIKRAGGRYFLIRSLDDILKIIE